MSINYRRGFRGNFAQSCWVKASSTFTEGFPGSARPGFRKIQLHTLQPHAAKVLFSSQINPLGIVEFCLVKAHIVNR
jgi:hypothetical protein